VATAEQFTGMQAVPAPSDWLTVLKQYGLATLLTILLLLYLAFFVVEPMRKAQERFMESVITTNAQNAATVARQTEIQQQQAKALQDIVPVLQQIRDDQRRGVWLDNKPMGKGS
jgi:hypothetical protein